MEQHRQHPRGGDCDDDAKWTGYRSCRDRSARPFEGNDLRFVVLQLISNGPSHGYEIMKTIQDRLGGIYAPSPGVIYPLLTMLKNMDHATVMQAGTRKLYVPTKEGAKSLADNKAMVEAIFVRMDQIRSMQIGNNYLQIERAVENFKLALRMKAHPLTTEQIYLITDIIDAAAKQIERV
jgi:DNA-binding PadR family transcriptional regulator